MLLNDLFGELDFPLLRDFLAGFETKISTHEGEKCRVLKGRTDALYGNLVIEFERGASGWLRVAKKQLQRYLAILGRNKETADTYFVPIATDGVSFVVFAPKEGPRLSGASDSEEMEVEKIEEFNLDKRQPADFYLWLDRYFLRGHKREPRTKNFLEDFGLKKFFEEVRGPHAIGRARTAVRAALSEELSEIDSLVKEILK